MNSLDYGQRNPVALPNDPRYLPVMSANKDSPSFIDIFILNREHKCFGKYCFLYSIGSINALVSIVFYTQLGT